MPELPEVERAARLLREHAVQRTIRELRTLHPSATRRLSADTARSLQGRTVVRVERRAKYQLLYLDDARIIEVHFKMTGDWAIGPDTLPPPPLERVRIVFDNGTRVSLIDGRAFAVVRVHEPNVPFLPPLGIEPLDPQWNGPLLHTALQHKRGPIKPALLDQRVVAGLGNIYAAESLWVARIHPAARANRLSLARVTRLADAARSVLEEAPAARYYGRRPTDDGHRYAIGDGGDDGWQVYGREGEACRRCDAIIRRVEQAGRSTYYCGGCQRI